MEQTQQQTIPFAYPAQLSNIGAVHAKNITGKGVLVGILDYSIDFSNQALATQNGGISFWPNTKNNQIVRDLKKIPATLNSSNAHGTSMAGIIAANTAQWKGVAPHSKLISLGVFEQNSNTYTSDDVFVALIDKAIERQVKVINISLDFPDDKLGKKEAAIRKAIQRGCVICCCAGNDLIPCGKGLGFPARLNITGLIVVGAATLSRKLFLASANDENIDLFAPAQHITTLQNGREGILQLGSVDSSSAATAMVTGVIALLLQANPSLTPQQIHHIISFSGDIIESTPLTPPCSQGKRYLNAEDAIKMALSYSKQIKEAQ
jgi:subtilisin family serine protease